MEIDFLKRRDQARNSGDHHEQQQQQPRLKFTDLEGETGEYDPSHKANGNISYQRGMGSMHAVLFNGEIMTGVPVFRVAYEQVGLG